MNRYLNGLTSFFNRGLPNYVVFFVTARCNARCKMCFYWRNIEKANSIKELTLDEIEKISRNLGRLQHLTITGGEPFLRKDIVEICQIFDRNNKVQFITLPTNSLLTEKIKNDVEKILQTCKNPYIKICLSMDNLFSKHDEIRNVKGIFKKVLFTYKNVARLKKKYGRMDIFVNTVTSGYNKDDIEKIYRFVKKNMKEAIFSASLARGNTKEKIAKDVSPERYESISKFLEKNVRRKNKFPFSSFLDAIKLVNREIIIERMKTGERKHTCLAGKRMIVINEIGDVLPCELLNVSFGNLRENNYSIKKILNSNQAKKIKQMIKEKKCCCTYECALQSSIPYSHDFYLLLLKKWLIVKGCFK